MSKKLSELLKLGFEHVGNFLTHDGKLKLTLSKYKSVTGSYAFVIGDTVCYIGVAKNSLSARMNGYKNPGPTQQTNKRINPKIKRAHEVRIYFLPESVIRQLTTTIRHGEFETEIPCDLSIFERFLISFLRPMWNRE